MRSTSARRFPSVFQRLALSNLAAQSAEQIGLAAAPIGAGTGSAIMALADPLGATGTVLNLPEGGRHNQRREQD